MDSSSLYDLLASTQIEDFDAVEEAFKLLDVEGKGYLDVQTFKEIFKNLKLGEHVSQQEIMEIIKEADLNNDGEINYKEFVKAMMSK